MSGILDNKSRVMDTILTFEGRKQIAGADLKVKYISFTDGATYYKADVASGSADATARIYLESCQLPQDQIVFEADDSGRLLPFRNGSDISLRAGQVLDYSFNALTASALTGSTQNVGFLSGDEFASTADTLLASSIDNFNKLRLIATHDSLFEDDGFGMGNQQVEFVINNERPLPDPTTHAAHINYLESLFQDPRLSRIPNFKYLPPINKLDDVSIDKRDHRQTWEHFLGHYPPWGRSYLFGLTGPQLEYELAYYERLGYSKTIVFEPTSMQNHLVGQFFEVNFNVMKKLDVIDFGTYIHQGQRKHAFFAGKLMTDDNNTHTFIHLFTLVFG